MKKSYAIICLILISLVCFIFVNFKKIEQKKQEIAKFNLIYEEYNKDNLNGLDITTVINKAVNNNEKYEIPKDKDGLYISDDENSIKIYITMIINGKTYPMEQINSLGISSFIEYFGNINFKCTNIKYHSKTGKISEMVFEATEY